MRISYLLFNVILLSCSNFKTQMLEEVIYKPKFSEQFAFKILNRNFEPSIPPGRIDSTKRASAHGVMVRLDVGHNSISFVKDFRCYSYIKNDTLKIILNNSDGFTGSSLSILVANDKFSCKSSQGTD